MPYEVILTRPALRAYQKLPYKLKVAVDRCIIELEENPKYGSNIQKLKGQPDCFRYQVGGWRILFKVVEINQEVRIYGIRPRGDVYKHGH